jgi:hypothetical protein
VEPAPDADVSSSRAWTGTGEAVPVAFVSSHPYRGGSERYLTLLLERLEPAGDLGAHSECRSGRPEVESYAPRAWRFVAP